MEHDGAVATELVATDEGVASKLRSGHVGVLVPVETSADLSGGVTDGGVVDGKHQSVETIIVGSIAGEGEAMPCEAVASSGVNHRAVPDGQVESHDAVASIDIAANERMGNRLGLVQERILIP